MIKLPSGKLVDLSKFAEVTVPDDNGDVCARLDSGMVLVLYGADGRAFYAAQLARVGKPDPSAVECLPQRRNPQHPTNCQCVDCSADYAIRVRAEIEAGMRCKKCLHRFCNCDCGEQE